MEDKCFIIVDLFAFISQIIKCIDDYLSRFNTFSSLLRATSIVRIVTIFNIQNICMDTLIFIDNPLKDISFCCLFSFKKTATDYFALFSCDTLSTFPETSNMLSRIKLIQQGTNTSLNLKQYEIITATVITIKISHEILRKYLNSFSVNGFSGVSSGQRKNIKTADTIVMRNSTV
jgi:hypothetical protein